VAGARSSLSRYYDLCGTHVKRCMGITQKAAETRGLILQSGAGRERECRCLMIRVINTRYNFGLGPCNFTRIPGSWVAPFPSLLWKVAFTACAVILLYRLSYTVIWQEPHKNDGNHVIWQEMQRASYPEKNLKLLGGSFLEDASATAAVTPPMCTPSMTWEQIVLL
jgi:hypothetical protein